MTRKKSVHAQYRCNLLPSEAYLHSNISNNETFLDIFHPWWLVEFEDGNSDTEGQLYFVTIRIWFSQLNGDSASFPAGLEFSSFCCAIGITAQKRRNNLVF